MSHSFFFSVRLDFFFFFNLFVHLLLKQTSYRRLNMAGKVSAKTTTVKQQKISTKKALELYKNTLNFNVISRYDPQIKQLLFNTSHCVLYKFNDDEEEWVKSDYQGTLALYLRDFQVPAQGTIPSYQDLQTLFCYGLVLLNRNNPECFSIGLLPNKVSTHFFPNGLNSNLGVSEMCAELNDNLIIIKNLLGDIYGLWIFNEDERDKLFKLIEFCLNNTSSIF